MPRPAKYKGPTRGTYEQMKKVLEDVDTKQAEVQVPGAFGPQHIITGDREVDRFLKIFTINAAEVQDALLMRRLYTMLLRLQCYTIKKDTPPWCIAAAVLGFPKIDFPHEFRPSDDNCNTGLMRLGLDGNSSGGFNCLKELEEMACRHALCTIDECDGYCISSGSRSHYSDGSPFVFQPCVKVPILPGEALIIGFRPDSFDEVTGELKKMQQESRYYSYDYGTEYHYGYGRQAGVRKSYSNAWSVGEWTKYPGLFSIPDSVDDGEYKFRSEYTMQYTNRDTMVPLSSTWPEKRPRYQSRRGQVADDAAAAARPADQVPGPKIKKRKVAAEADQTEKGAECALRAPVRK